MSAPLLAVRFIADGDHLQAVDLSLDGNFSYSFEGASLSLQKQLSEWFESYLVGRPKSISLSQRGSLFQQKVMDSLQSIPFGSTLSYRGLAEKIGHAKAARAVGNACGKNKIPLIIPCHRVIEKNGDLGGFAFGPEIKKRLLLFERQHNRIF